MPQHAREHLVQVHRPLELPDRRDSYDRGGDVIGNRASQLELLGIDGTRLAVVDHELADEPAIGNQGDEGEPPNALTTEHGHQRRELLVLFDVGDDDGLRALDVASPRRVSFHCLPIGVGEPTPGLEAHHVVIVVGEDR